MLDLGINFNVDDGAKKVGEELKAWQAKWQKLLDSEPLTINFNAKEVTKSSAQASKAVEKNLNSIRSQIAYLQQEYNNLELGGNLSSEGKAILDMLHELQEKAGIYAKSMGVASKEMQELLSDTVVDKLKRLEKAWNALTVEERKGSYGQSLIAEMNEIVEALDGYGGSLARAAAAQRKMAEEQKKLSAPKGLKEQLRDLSAEWDKLNKSEREGAIGQDIITKYRAIKEDAGELALSIEQVIKAQDRLVGEKSLSELDELRKSWNSLQPEQRDGEEGLGLIADFRKIKAEIDEVNTSLDQAVEKQIQVEQATKKTTKEFNQLKTYAANFVSIYGGIRFLKSIVAITGELEMQRVSLSAMLQDAHRGEKIFSQIKDLAVKSPFQIMDLVSYAKQLSAFSVPYEELFETTKNLADVSAGLGVDMGRIILAYGQVRSAAVLRGQELRQFTEAGIPLIELLADKFTELNGEVVRTGEVFDMIYRRKVSFEMVKDIFSDMTSEGGKFYKMQEKQAETLKGMVKNLKDAYDVMASEIGEGQSDILKGAVVQVKKLMEHHEAIFNILIPTITALGLYKVLMIAIGSADVFKKQIVNLNNFLRALAVGTGNLKNFMNTMKLAFSPGNIPAMASALFGVILMVNELRKSANKLKIALNEITSSKFTEALWKERDIQRILNAIEKTEKGTQSYRDSIDELNRKYKEFLPEQITYASSFDDIAAAVKRAQTAIMEYAKVQSLDEGKDKITESYSKSVDKSVSKLEKLVANSMKYSNEVTRSVDGYVKVFTDYARDNLEMFEENEDLFRSLAAQMVRKELPNWGGDHSQGIALVITKFAKDISKMNKDTDKLIASLDSKYGTDTRIEKELEASEAKFKKEMELLNAEVLTVAEVNKEKERLEKEHLARMVDIYEKSGLGETRDAKTIKEQLKADLADWQKTVNKVIGSERSFLTIESTDYTALDYVKRVRGEYANLMSDYETYSNLHDDESKRIASSLLIQKKATEDVADAMGFTLETAKETAKKGITELELFLAALEERVSEYRSRMEIWSTATEGVQSRYGLSKFKMDFDVTFDGKPKLSDYIKTEIKNIADKEGLKVDLDIDFQTASLSDMLSTSGVNEDVLKVVKSLFEELRKISSQEYEDLDKLLENYLGYTQRKIEADRKYMEVRQKMLNLMKDDYSPQSMAVVKEMLDEAKYEYEQTLVRLAEDVASRDEGFQQFVKDIANQGVEQLMATLTIMEAQLLMLKTRGKADTKNAAILEAQIKALKEELRGAKIDKESKEKPQDAYNQWRRLHTVLSRVNKAFSDIGDSFQNMFGEATTLAGDIATGTMSIISSIGTLSEMTVKSTEGAAKGASKSIQAVEKASVILAMVGAAISIAKKIWDFASKTKELSEEKIKEYESLVAATNKVIDSQARLLESMTGGAAVEQHDKVTDAIKRQTKAHREQAKEYLASGGSLFKRSIGVKEQRKLQGYSDELKKLGINYDDFGRNLSGMFDLSTEQIGKLIGTDFWYALKEEVRDYLEKIYEAEQKTEDMAEKLNESLTGVDFSNVIDGLDEFIKMADRDFDTVAKNFEEYMLDALLHIVKSKYLTDALSDWYEDLAGKLKDETLTENEVQRLKIAYEEIAKRAAEMFDISKDIAGIEVTGDSNLTGIAKGIASASEDSILLLAGYMDSLRFKLFPYIDRMENEFLNTFSTLALAQAEHVNHLRAIELNTQVTADTNTKMLENIGKVISPEGVRGSYAINVNA